MSSLFPLLSRLARIRLLGSEVEVPEKQPVLRCLQYLHPIEISHGDFCWNNECGNCEVVFKSASGSGNPRRTRCCQYVVADGMEIIELSKELDRCIGRSQRRV